MEQLQDLSMVAVAIVGWAATVLAALGNPRLTDTDQRAMVVCSWVFWSIFGLGTLVQRELLTVDGAAMFVGITGALMATIVIASARVRRTRP
ncbi:hypothetical protein HC891_09695 [Candidatus Gracilibacteria bacterium]|nr:hypothetical protein [Candidatus Gracilibacteria bacterium]